MNKMARYSTTIDVVAFQIDRITARPDGLYELFDAANNSVLVRREWMDQYGPVQGCYFVQPPRDKPYCLSPPAFELHYVRRYEPEQEQDHEQSSRLVDDAQPQAVG
jgi:hypothetical protein